MTNFEHIVNQLGKLAQVTPDVSFHPDLVLMASLAGGMAVLLGALLRLRLRRNRLAQAVPARSRVSAAEQAVREAMEAVTRPAPAVVPVQTVPPVAEPAVPALALTELQHQLHMQSSVLQQQNERMQMLEQRVSGMRQESDTSRHPYELAIALAGEGLTVEALARRCGITPAEADLIQLLHGTAH